MISMLKEEWAQVLYRWKCAQFFCQIHISQVNSYQVQKFLIQAAGILPVSRNEKEFGVKIVSYNVQRSVVYVSYKYLKHN